MSKTLSYFSNNPKMVVVKRKGFSGGGEVTENDRPRLQISGGGASIEDDPAPGVKVRGVGAGGRVGYRFDAGKNADVTVGVSGSASKVKVDTPEGSKTYRDKRITGGDVTYRRGNTSYGVSYSETPKEKGTDRRVMFKLKKDF
jgi:hypothetical protein